MSVDVRNCDEAGVMSLIARERHWRALWAETQAQLVETQEELRVLKADHERLLGSPKIGSQGGLRT